MDEPVAGAIIPEDSASGATLVTKSVIEIDILGNTDNRIV